jgi:hypothetical protein
MDEFERRVAALLDEVVPEPGAAVALDDVRVLTRPRLASARRRVRVAEHRRSAIAPRRNHRLAVLGAVAVAAIVAAGSYLLTRAADQGGTPTPVTNPAALTATAWQLVEITRPGAAAEPASAPVYFDFGKRSSTDHDGDAAISHIAIGRITFSAWANNLTTGNQVPNLDLAQDRFIFTLMQGTLSWSITGDTLTFHRSGAGSLTFRRSNFNQHPPHVGALHGRFLAVGGPAPGTPRPMSGAGTVSFTETHTGQVQTIDVLPDGRFGTPIAPGRYTVAGHISSYGSGHAACAALGPVTVQVNQDVRVDVYCQEN